MAVVGQVVAEADRVADDEVVDLDGLAKADSVDLLQRVVSADLLKVDLLRVGLLRVGLLKAGLLKVDSVDLLQKVGLADLLQKVVLADLLPKADLHRADLVGRNSRLEMGVALNSTHSQV